MGSDASRRQESGFKTHTLLADARDRLLEQCRTVDRTEQVALGGADNRVLATSVSAPRDVPHYRRAAMDGYAIRAADTFQASERSPVVLDLTQSVTTGTAVPIQTGQAVPADATAVVKLEDCTELDNRIELTAPVPERANIAPVGEDVTAGSRLFEAGHRLSPSDLALLRSVGRNRVKAYHRPTVGIVPTGNELVRQDPAPGETIESNGVMVATLTERWGATPTYRNIVRDDRDAIRTALQRDLTKDLIVTTGGSSVGDRDLLPEVIADLGELLVHGVAIKPGHPVAIGVIEETPVIALPGYPVACLVNAVQFIRPALAALVDCSPVDHPTVQATLDGKLPSDPGVRTFARVQLEEGPDGLIATPVQTSGSGVLSSVTTADGWIVISEQRDGIDDGASVTVQQWEQL